MASNATIISSTIPQFPKDSIPDGTNYLDSELHMMTQLQYHRLWRSPILRLPLLFHLQYPHRIQFDSWQDEDGRAHAFMLFNMKPKVTRQFLGKDDETTKEMWDAVQHRYCSTNNTQMIALENQLANLHRADHRFCLYPKTTCFQKPMKKSLCIS